MKRFRRHVGSRPVATGIAVVWLILALAGASSAVWCRPFFPEWTAWQRILACTAPLVALGLFVLYCVRPIGFALLHCFLLPLLALSAVVFAVVSPDAFPAVVFAPFCLLAVPYLVRELRKKQPPSPIDFFPGARTAGASISHHFP